MKSIPTTSMVEMRTSIGIIILMTRSLTEIGVMRKTRCHFIEDPGEVRQVIAFMISANSGRNSRPKSSALTGKRKWFMHRVHIKLVTGSHNIHNNLGLLNPPNEIEQSLQRSVSLK